MRHVNDFYRVEQLHLLKLKAFLNFESSTHSVVCALGQRFCCNIWIMLRSCLLQDNLLIDMAALHVCLPRCCCQVAILDKLQMCGVWESSCTRSLSANTLSLAVVLIVCLIRYTVVITRYQTMSPNLFVH